MAFRSEAHKAKMKQLLEKKLITQAQYDQHERETSQHVVLPARLPEKPKGRR